MAFLLIIHCCKAQHISIKRKYEQITDADGNVTASTYKYRGFLVEGEYEPRRIGFFGQHLKEYVRSDSNALGYMRSFATFKAIKLGTTAAGLTLFCLYVARNTNKEALVPANGDKDFGKAFLPPLYITAILGTIFWVIPPVNIEKAVDSYNLNIDNKSSFRFKGIDLNMESGPVKPYPSLGIRFGI